MSPTDLANTNQCRCRNCSCWSEPWRIPTISQENWGCPNTDPRNISRLSITSVTECRRMLTHNLIPLRFTQDWSRLSLSLSLIVRQTFSRPVCPGTKHPSGAYDQIFITFWQLRFCFCWAPSLTRWRVCLLYMLLALASAVLLGSESLCSRDNILLSQYLRLPFSSPPTTGRVTVEVFDPASTRVGQNWYRKMSYILINL
jgi:hypothetical protein